MFQNDSSSGRVVREGRVVGERRLVGNVKELDLIRGVCELRDGANSDKANLSSSDDSKDAFEAVVLREIKEWEEGGAVPGLQGTVSMTPVLRNERKERTKSRAGFASPSLGSSASKLQLQPHSRSISTFATSVSASPSSSLSTPSSTGSRRG